MVVNLGKFDKIAGVYLDQAAWEQTFIGVLATTTLALNAKVVIELGTGKGRSTRAFLTALKMTDGVLYTVDKAAHPEIIEYLKNEKRVVFIKGDFSEVGRNWGKGVEPVSIDILFFDNGYTYEHAWEVLEIWSKFNPRVIFVHDTWSGGKATGLFQVIGDYGKKHGKKVLNLPSTYGLGMIVSTTPR